MPPRALCRLTIGAEWRDYVFSRILHAEIFMCNLLDLEYIKLKQVGLW